MIVPVNSAASRIPPMAYHKWGKSFGLRAGEMGVVCIRFLYCSPLGYWHLRRERVHSDVPVTSFVWV